MSATTTRVRGLAPWAPHPATRALLEQVRSVLDEYQDHLPLTLRQIYYRLVAAHGLPKTDAAYSRLCEHLNRARRAGLIPWDAIRDDDVTEKGGDGWESAAQLVQTFVHLAETFTLDRQQGQPRHLILLAEAGGMVPQLSRVASAYGIAVHSSGGFDSVTAKRNLATRLGAFDAAEMLHVGDHDPSGVHLFTSLADDVQQLARDAGLSGDIRFTRIAVTPAQVAEHDLPTAPPKPTDRRAFDGETVQAEALPPEVLAGIVRDAITARLDHAAYAAVLEAETTARRELTSRLRPILHDMGGAA